MPVLSGLITAGFVNGDTGVKPTSNMVWTNETITAEEVAVIVPIPEAVLDDATYDIWGEVRPEVESAFGAVIDAAALVGTNKPATWPTAIVVDAAAKSQVLDYSTHIGTAGNNVFTALLGESGLFAFVEADGYMVNGMVAVPTMKARIRGLTDTTGRPIVMTDPQTPTRYVMDGVPVDFLMNGTLDPTSHLAVAGDWTKFVYAIRQDITYKVLDQAVIQDQAGNILYNLAQQDMVALRVVMRLGWARPNAANRVNTTAANRYPWAVLVP